MLVATPATPPRAALALPARAASALTADATGATRARAGAARGAPVLLVVAAITPAARDQQHDERENEKTARDATRTSR